MSSGKWRPICFGLNVLIGYYVCSVACVCWFSKTLNVLFSCGSLPTATGFWNTWSAFIADWTGIIYFLNFKQVTLTNLFHSWCSLEYYNGSSAVFNVLCFGTWFKAAISGAIKVFKITPIIHEGSAFESRKIVCERAMLDSSLYLNLELS